MHSDNLFFAVDFGEQNSKLLVSSPFNGQMQICASFVTKTQGIKDGMVLSKTDLHRTFLTLLEQARQAKYEVHDLIIVLPSNKLNVYRKRATISIEAINRVVSSQEIKALHAGVGDKKQFPASELVVHIAPIQYFIDNESVKLEVPIGYRALEVGLDAYIVTLPATTARTIVDVVQEANITISKAIIAPLALAEAILTPNERQEGALILDCGANHIGICYVANGLLTSYKGTERGFDSLTQQVMQAFHCDYATAESMKLIYGIADLNEARTIAVHALSDQADLLSEYDINRPIDAAIDQLILEIEKALKFVKNERNIPLVLTGGGANLIRLEHRISDALSMPCRVAKMNIVGGRDPAFHACYGALMASLKSTTPKE